MKFIGKRESVNDDFTTWKGTVVSIIGLSKNAGKTTTMNYLLNKSKDCAHRIGLTSIGLDGEEFDFAGGHEKPRIFVPEGTIIATGSKLIEKCDITKRILCSAGYTTAVGTVYLIEALSSGYVQLGGPSLTEQMIKTKDLMLRAGVEFLFVDGAAGRKSSGSAAIADGLILCTSANTDSNIDKVVEMTVFYADLFTRKRAIADGDNLIIKGAITDNVISQLLRDRSKIKDKYIFFDDPFKIICSVDKFNILCSCVREVCFINAPRLLAISVNPTSIYGWSFPKEEFKEKIQEKVNIPVIDVK